MKIAVRFLPIIGSIARPRSDLWGSPTGSESSTCKLDWTSDSLRDLYQSVHPLISGGSSNPDMIHKTKGIILATNNIDIQKLPLTPLLNSTCCASCVTSTMTNRATLSRHRLNS